MVAKGCGVNSHIRERIQRRNTPVVGPGKH